MLMQSLPEVSAPMQECRCRSGVPAAIRAAGPHRALVRTHKFAVPGLRRQRGFTLLEALVAVVIMAMIMTTAFVALRLRGHLVGRYAKLSQGKLSEQAQLDAALQISGEIFDQ